MMASEIDGVVEGRNKDFQWEGVNSHVTQSETLVSSEGRSVVIVMNIHVNKMVG
jgi:hypothetical protein